RPTSTRNATRRGSSNAGFTTIGESPSVTGRARSERYASAPKTTAHAAVKARKPRVASVRSRARITAPSEPIASAVSSVQLMNARFSAIRSAGTSRVYRWRAQSRPIASPPTMGGTTKEVARGTRPRHDDHVVRPLLLGDPDAGRPDDPPRPVVLQPQQPQGARRRRPLRPDARHPRPFRPLRRRAADREPDEAGLAVHARAEPVAE